MAKKSKLQIWSEYLAVRATLGILGAIPRKAAINAGGTIARFASYVVSSLRRTGRRNLEIAFPELSSGERERLLNGTFENLGRIVGEMSRFSKSTPQSLARSIKFEFDPETIAEYENMKAAGRGAIIVSPHLGNWELLVFAWSALREPISYLARPLDNPLLEELTVSLRTRFGNRPINKTNAVAMAIRILRDGGTLGILADVNAHPKEGVFVPFFGVPACTSTGPAMLAIRTNSVIVPLCGVWDKVKRCYVARHGQIIEPPSTGDRHRDIQTITAAFTAEIEKMVRAYPDQWLWFHKRWKTRPLGEPEIY